MTTADVANDKPNVPRNPWCKATDAKAIGQTFGVDLACTGKTNGTGHVLTATGDEQTSIVAKALSIMPLPRPCLRRRDRGLA